MILQVIILIFSIVIHECSHGLIALFRGDETAKRSGRLTLNPIKHVDPIGSVVLPIIEWITTHQIFFAYAKPVPVNPWMLKNPKRDMLWVGLAGPLSNALLAILFSLGFRWLGGAAVPVFLRHALISGVYLNLWLAVINLLPIPPLDGSKMMSSLVSDRWSAWMGQLDRIGMFIIMLLVMTNFFDKVIQPVIMGLLRILVNV